jgi:hypothetical protein
MCYYRFYIFLGCGHTTTSSTPVRYCANATNPVTSSQQEESSPIRSPVGFNTSDESALDLDADSQPTVIQQSLPTAQPNQSANNIIKDVMKRISPDLTSPELEACGEGRMHPLHTVRVARLCASCAIERDERLQAIDLDSVVFKVGLKQRHSKVIERHQALLLDGGSGERQRKSKVDSGVWTVGTRWMKDWKHQG